MSDDLKRPRWAAGAPGPDDPLGVRENQVSRGWVGEQVAGAAPVADRRGILYFGAQPQPAGPILTRTWYPIIGPGSAFAVPDPVPSWARLVVDHIWLWFSDSAFATPDLSWWLVVPSRAFWRIRLNGIDVPGFGQLYYQVSPTWGWVQPRPFFVAQPNDRITVDVGILDPFGANAGKIHGIRIDGYYVPKGEAAA